MSAQTTWKIWGLQAELTVEDDSALPVAKALVDSVLNKVELASSRFRPDSELMQLARSGAQNTHVSPTLAALIDGALQAARNSDGDIDPLLGTDLVELGYDRDIDLLPQTTIKDVSITQRVLRPILWPQIELHGTQLTLPAGTFLDLGATAKAMAADWCAAEVAEELDTAVLVSLGGDIATAGTAQQPWQILVQDTDDAPSQQISLHSGFSLATSSTQKRRWSHRGLQMHHILDPRFGLPAHPVHASITVAAPTCLEANTYSTAGIVRGTAALDWLESLELAARLVDLEGRVHATSRWPREATSQPKVSAHG
ncbi:FAD:protein FMN transferase [Arthrobacter sp. NIO-1057]|uniref:FAD:protein FMN transferase n=1 Tax=Arthrobacter sp. NIO-1057 TaxID=993071 RepID=UPI00071E3609|nr:FAD:protein FMN transferase [Arthrobacter sp. NIO-1057]KSU65345.1 hypothetical protein AS038_13535 [Arthrobacter sp. NIO-1057]SCC44886.1 thiamine biosynthesis lipoprotein [Arthrobacter sp. NIO-1057]